MPIFPLQDSCPVGYTFNLERLKCEDVNECQTNEHDCLESQRCDNTLGSFTCVRYVTCGTGYTLNYNTGEFLLTMCGKLGKFLCFVYIQRPLRGRRRVRHRDTQLRQTGAGISLSKHTGIV